MSGKTLQVEILGCTKGVNELDVLKLIEKGGRTAYQSQDKITEDSAERFVRALRKSGHESVIEHSWFVFHLHQNGSRNDIVSQLLLANDLLTVTFRQEGTILVSGNARMWRDFFRSDHWQANEDSELRHILIKVLAEKYPVLFEDLDFKKDIEVPQWVIYNPHLNYTPREMRRHWWAMVRFTGGTRAFTHQFVRHRRKTAFTQESQRYCDEGGFYGRGYFGVPLSVREAGDLFLEKEGITLGDWYLRILEDAERHYKDLQGYLKEAKEKGMTKGKVNEDARYLLPNAVCSEIVFSAPLEEWRWVFKMRTAPDAQWEIRLGMIQLLRQFQNIFPGVFDDFQIDQANAKATVNMPSFGY